MFYVYIVCSVKCQKYYIGYSKNPENRLLNKHNAGLVIATRNCYPYVLKAKKAFFSEKEAVVEELRIKKMKSKKYIEYLLNGDW
jgi:putative endonuclease